MKKFDLLAIAGIGEFGCSLLDKLKSGLGNLKSGFAQYRIRFIKEPKSPLPKADITLIITDTRKKKNIRKIRNLCSSAKKNYSVVVLCTPGQKKNYEQIRKLADTMLIVEKEEEYIRLITGIIESRALPSLVGFDFFDLFCMLIEGKIARTCLGKAEGKNNAQNSIKKALKQLPKEGMKNMHIQIRAGENISLEKINEIGEIGTDWSNEDSNVIWSAQIDKKLKDECETLCLVTYKDGYEPKPDTQAMERQKNELKHFFRIFKKVIESGILREREAIDLCTVFMICACDYKEGDYYYNKLLGVQIRKYKK